jgi:hypothetical protein
MQKLVKSATRFTRKIHAAVDAAPSPFPLAFHDIARSITA